MKHDGSESMHLQGVTFEIYYPPSPYHPNTPVFAQFSGVLNADGGLHARLDAGSIPGSPTPPGVRIHGFFAVGPGEPRRRFSGFLCNDRITGEV